VGDTKIEWTEKSWNPVTGCTLISPGCKNCYAKKMANRLKGRYGYPEENDGFTPGTVHEDKLNEPLSWKKSRRIFVCSMGDLFHKDVSLFAIESVFQIMRNCPQHTFMLLTKRPDNMITSVLNVEVSKNGKIPKNILIGVTAENQEQWDWRTKFLGLLSGITTFVSVEPMLEEVNAGDNIQFVDWVICGAETGPGARYMRPEWALDLKEQCKAAGVPFFMKQMSEKKAIPPYLQCREFPK